MSPARQRPTSETPLQSIGITLPKAERFAVIKSAIKGLGLLEEAAFNSAPRLPSNNIRMMPIRLRLVLDLLLTGAQSHERGNHIEAHRYVQQACDIEEFSMSNGGKGRDYVEKRARKELCEIMTILLNKEFRKLPNNEGKFGNLKLAIAGLEEVARRTLVFIDILKEEPQQREGSTKPA